MAFQTFKNCEKAQIPIRRLTLVSLRNLDPLLVAAVARNNNSVFPAMGEQSFLDFRCCRCSVACGGAIKQSDAREPRIVYLGRDGAGKRVAN